MKKQIFLVIALVAIAMSSMFVACSDKNEPINGCSCTIVWEDGTKENASMSLSEMREEYGVATCEALHTEISSELNESYQWFKTLSCKRY